jgi:hypothetical protein
MDQELSKEFGESELTNQELREIYRSPDLVADIKMRSFDWLARI